MTNQRGQIIVLALVFLAAIATVAVSFVSYETLVVRQSKKNNQQAAALALAEAGVNKAIWSLNQGAYNGETTTLGSGALVVTVSDIDTNTKIVESTGYLPSASQSVAQKKIRVQVTTSPPTTDGAFNYAVQIGAGGLKLGDGAKINGTIYTNGNILGAGRTKSTITGEAWAAATSTIEKVKVQSHAHANTIKDSNVWGDAYYQTLTNTTVSGTLHSGAANPATRSFAIADSQISAWKTAAEVGGVISGDYAPSDNLVSLGPKKITGNLTVSHGQTLLLTGTVWVQGKIKVGNNGVIRLDTGYHDKSGVLLADGAIDLNNNITLASSGDPKSFLMVLTLSNCDGDSGSDCAANHSAINLNNNAASAILFARNGLVYLNNNVSASELTAYKIKLENNAQVTYTSGLASSSFSNSPAGAWRFLQGTWQEE